MNIFETMYREKLTTAADIASRTQNGDLFITDIANALPPAIYGAINQYVANSDVKDVKIATCLDFYPLPCYTNPEVAKKITGISFFAGLASRKAINKGFADYLSYYYRDLPRMISEEYKGSILCATVSPMDEHGYFSFGTTASALQGTLSGCKYIYLEVNNKMPRSFGGPIVHISQVTALCENNVPLIALPDTPLDEKSITIGNLIAEHIPDCATVQLGIGAIPNAVGEALKSKKHLGIHTEMLTSSMLELIECGAADNSMKPINRGKSVATFALGSQKLYDYINNNPAVLIQPAEYVNDIKVIASHPKMMSVNSAVQVDLFGQISSESFGTKYISGTGGQVDYVRGAMESEGGKSFIALTSTNEDETVSKIQPILEPGTIVTTSKCDVDYVVTEYGIAHLRWRTMSQRAKALIAIAHPKFRDELTFVAKENGILI